MKLLKDCSTAHFYPWIHYTIQDYFDDFTLNYLLENINQFSFNKSEDSFREECRLSHNNDIISNIIDNFIKKDNINFLSSIDNRLNNHNKLLRISIWKDYKNFHLPIHTDIHYKLFTMQIYLPRNNELGYGTTFYDQNEKFVKKTEYTLNGGYFFFPNINKIKTNHSFVENIKTERCSLVFNVFNKDVYVELCKKNQNEDRLSCCIEF